MIRYFAEHPTAGNLMMLAFLLLGASALFDIKRESMPDFTIQTVEISAVYPGAAAAEVEEAVAAPIEEALESVVGIRTVRTFAMEGAVSIRVEMEEGADWQEFSNDIRTEVGAISSFPRELERLVVRPFNFTDHVFSIAVHGDMSPLHLKDYCEEIKARLIASTEGVMVDIAGFSQREFLVEPRPEALRAHNLTVLHIASLIRSRNADIPSGTLRTGDRDLKLRFSDRRRTVDDIAGLRILHSESGNELALGDIASVTERFTRDEDKVLFNEWRAGVITVSKSRTADSLSVFARANAILEQVMAEAPAGVHFTITRNTASTIRDRLNMLYGNAVIGFILVFLTLWLFLNIRLSFWVAMGLPISFLGGLFVMNRAGISLNMVSTFALLIALGLLMDDAIVIAENIAEHLAKGKPALDAAVDGTREVAPGVLSSFATTICVFVPLMFLRGTIGRILFVIPATLVIVLCVSLFEAFFILPGHIANSMARGLPRPNAVRSRIDALVDRVRFGFVGPAVKRLLRWRYALLSGVFALFAVSLSLFASGHLKFIVFPDVDGDTVTVKVQLPPGTPLAESEAAAEKLRSAAERMNERLKHGQPGGRDLVESTSVYFSVNQDVADSGPHLFTVYADLLAGDVRTSTVAEILAVWREEAPDIPGAMSVKFEDASSSPGGKPIEIRLIGRDLDTLRDAAASLRARLADYRGVFDIADDLTPGKPEIVMSMKPGALMLGLDATDVARQLRAAYQGETADELRIGGESHEINVRLRDHPGSNLAGFDNFLLRLDGNNIPLASVVDMEHRRSPSTIKRHNGRRAVTVTADIDASTANAMEVTRDLTRSFLPGLLREHPGVDVSLGGQRETARETGGSVLWAFLAGVVGVFILLSLQFRSYLEPLVIMSIIPLAVVGAIWGHLAFGIDFSIQSLIGVVSTAGIVVNGSILLLEFVKIHEKAGLSPDEATGMASSGRFRALMLANITTIAGLLPILVEPSLQARTLAPLALSVVSGLIAATLMILFITPAMYMAVRDYRNWRGRGG